MQSANTVVSALCARIAVGLESASTIVGAVTARSAVGHKYASTVVGAPYARSAVVQESASTVVSATDARSAALHKISRVEDITSSPRSPRHSFAVAADPTVPPLTRSPTALASSRTSSNPCDALNATRSLHVFAGTVGGLMAGT